MREKTYETRCGAIRYWTNEEKASSLCLVFLPGLTADHRLFEKQTEAFAGRIRVLVWDPPAHAASWPFTFDFSLKDEALWLDGIFEKEGIDNPVIVGQSMGGYAGQMYAELFPEKLKGFVSIDSAPLARRYTTAWEIRLLKKMEPVYRLYPWKMLKKTGTEGVAVTEYGRALMRSMMESYEGDKERYVKISGHGMRMLAEAMEADLPYGIPCPALLICGEKDRAGSAKRYNKAWHRETGIPLVWIPNAGHNSNTDAPEEVNGLLRELIDRIEKQEGEPRT